MFVTTTKLLLLLLFHQNYSSAAVCVVSDNNMKIVCEYIVLDDIYKEYFSLFQFNFLLPPDSTLLIANSNLTEIEYFHKPPDRLKGLSVLEIINSSVKIISNSTFNDFVGLKILNLGFNSLEDISFVESLPKSIKKLLLNNNNISFLSVDFTTLSLETLDLSYNKIKSVNFEQVRRVYRINFSNNEIVSIFFKHFDDCLNKYNLNLSSNKIVDYDDTGMSSKIDLDLSYNNNLRSVKLGEKEYLNLAHSKVDDFVNGTFVNSVDLRSFNNVNIVNLSLTDLILKDTNFSDQWNLITEKFKPISFNIPSSLDLSNSSITRIPENYFLSNSHHVVNFSFNNIQVIPTNTFTQSNLFFLDLSNSKIQTLQPSSFREGSIFSLNLNKNKISSLENFVKNTRIDIIDLSFNPIKYIKKNYFVNCKKLKKIILSNCLIQNIEPGTFSTTLSNLDLDYNNLTVLNEGMFVESLIELKLNGNPVVTIKRGSFSNLYRLSKLDFSNLRIENIEPHSFTNLKNIKEINLANNRIKLIESNLFVNVEKLWKIDFSNNPINKINKFSNKLNILDLTLTFNDDFQPSSIENLNIRKLTIKNSTISTLKSGSFKGLYGLTELYFDNSSIGSLEPGALQDLISLVHLDEQNLFKNIKNINRNVLNDLKSLEKLNLSSMDLKNLDSYCFDGLNKVQTLDLSHNNISELKSNTFYGLESLETLDLSNNNIGIFEKEVFIDINNLMVLNLAFNNLERIDVSLFQHFKHLKELNVSNNNFGSSAFRIGTLSSLIELKILDLSNNSLNYLDVRTLFMSLKKLSHLYLDQNNLKTLDYNSLLKNCKNLSYVGISYNMWKCDYLPDILESLNNNNVSYYPIVPVYDVDNIEGIYCT